MVHIPRIHGRNGRAYVALASGGSAEPVAFLKTWSISFTVDKSDVTAFGDPNHVYVGGLPDAQGAFDGFYDDATVQTYTAAVDGVARKFYLYPSTLLNTQYFYGTILPDFSVSSAVDGPVEISSSWNASGPMNKAG